MSMQIDSHCLHQQLSKCPVSSSLLLKRMRPPMLCLFHVPWLSLHISVHCLQCHFSCICLFYPIRHKSFAVRGPFSFISPHSMFTTEFCELNVLRISPMSVLGLFVSANEHIAVLTLVGPRDIWSHTQDTLCGALGVRRGTQCGPSGSSHHWQLLIVHFFHNTGVFSNYEHIMESICKIST